MAEAADNSAPDIAFSADLPPDLARIVAAWPRLSEETRLAIIKLVDG
jgi:hypothetical protein